MSSRGLSFYLPRTSSLSDKSLAGNCVALSVFKGSGVTKAAGAGTEKAGGTTEAIVAVAGAGAVTAAGTGAVAVVAAIGAGALKAAGTDAIGAGLAAAGAPVAVV